jgi:hypothetical protein
MCSSHMDALILVVPHDLLEYVTFLTLLNNTFRNSSTGRRIKATGGDDSSMRDA